MSIFDKQISILIENINYVSYNDKIKYCDVLEHPCFTKIANTINDEYGCEIVDIDYTFAIIKNINKYIFIEIEFDFTNYEILFRIQSFKYLNELILNIS